MERQGVLLVVQTTQNSSLTKLASSNGPAGLWAAPPPAGELAARGRLIGKLISSDSRILYWMLLAQARPR